MSAATLRARADACARRAAHFEPADPTDTPANLDAWRAQVQMAVALDAAATEQVAAQIQAANLRRALDE